MRALDRPERNAGRSGFGAFTFGVYDEGGGVRSLYVRPTCAAQLGRAVLPWAHGRTLAALTPLPAPDGCSALPLGGWLAHGEAVVGLREPVEAAILSRSVSPRQVDRILPACLLAHPDRALPPELGAVAAFSVDHAGHGVVLSREPRVLAACLRQALLVAGPDMDPRELDALIEPLPPGAWHRLELGRRRRYRVALLATVDGQRGGPPYDRSTWVAPLDGGSWKAGWSW